MYALALLLVVALLSLIITRIATVVLTTTGMSRTSARFQARSALSGVGFTTGESELIVNHPVRRRVVMTLMLLGNVGLVTAMAGLLRTFVGASGAGAGVTRAGWLVAGLGLIYLVSRSRYVDRILSPAIAWLVRRYTDLDVRDYASLLHVAGDYAVKEVMVRQDDWLAGQALGQLRLRDEGIIVLGVVRQDGTYVGVPHKDLTLTPGDTVVLYGRGDAIAALDTRPRGASGDVAHRQAAAQQRRISWGEDQADTG